MITKPLNVNRMTGYVTRASRCVSERNGESVVLTKRSLERFQATDSELPCSFSSWNGCRDSGVEYLYVEQRMAPLLRSKRSQQVNHILLRFWRWRTYASVWHSVTSQILEVDAELKEAVKAFKKN